MVKTPRTRHSGAQRDPLTIDLDADAVSRIPDDKGGAAEAAAAGTDPIRADNPPEAETATETWADAPGAGEQTQPDQVPDPAESGTEAERPDYVFDAGDKTASEPAYAAEPTYGSGLADPVSVKTDRSGLSLLAAGLIGGAVVLVGGGILQYSGLLGQASPVAGAPALDGVNAEIAALKSEIATLRETPAAGDAGRIDGLGQSVEQMRAEIASLRESLASGRGSGDTAGLDARLKEIETAVAGIGSSETGASPAEITAINEKIAGLDALAKAAGEAGSATDSRLGVIEQSLAALTAKADAQAAQPKIALAIAASALKSAIERGEPFQSEIETFAAIVPDAPELAALRAHAESGVASEAEIAAETDAAAKAIIAAASPVSQNAGFFERLLDSAGSMVSVRPIGAVEGAGVPETVARMEVAINAGDLAAALAEFDSLPEAARAAGAPFGDKMRARVEAEKLIDQAIAAAMQAA